MRVTIFLFLLFLQFQSFALSLTMNPSAIGCGHNTVSGTFDCSFTGSIVLNVSGGVELAGPTPIVSVVNGNISVDLIVDGSDNHNFVVSGIIISSNLSCAAVNTNYSSNMTHNCHFPINDRCPDAKVLPIGNLICNYTLSNTQNTQPSSSPSCGGSGYVDLWYEFVSQGHEITLELGTFPGSVIFYSMFENSCGGTQVACGLLSTFGSDNVTVTGLTDGLNYKIQVLHIGSASGPLQEVCIYTDLAALGSLALEENAFDIDYDNANDHVNLSWNDQLTGGDYFQVFRTLDNNTEFELIATLDDIDQFETELVFSDTDRPLAEKYFYKIRKLNIRDSEIYTMHNSIYIEEDNSLNSIPNEFHVWPNPSKGDITLSLLNDKIEDADITVYDVQGRKLFSTIKTLKSGINVLQLSLSDIGQGIFNVDISTTKYRMSKRLQIID